MLIDANSGLRFEVKIREEWVPVVAWDDYGDPYVLDVTDCKLSRVDVVTQIRAVASDG